MLSPTGIEPATPGIGIRWGANCKVASDLDISIPI